MQPMGKEPSSRGDIVSPSFDSVLMLVRNRNSTHELVPTTIQLEKDDVVVKKRQQQQQMVCSSPPLNDDSDDDPDDVDVSTDNDTVASLDVVSSSGSGEGASFSGYDSSSQGSVTGGTDASHDFDTEEEDDDDEVVATDASFAALRWSYLIVTLVIMLADGLQGMLAGLTTD